MQYTLERYLAPIDQISLDDYSDEDALATDRSLLDQLSHLLVELTRLQQSQEQPRKFISDDRDLNIGLFFKSYPSNTDYALLWVITSQLDETVSAPLLHNLYQACNFLLPAAPANQQCVVLACMAQIGILYRKREMVPSFPLLNLQTATAVLDRTPKLLEMLAWCCVSLVWAIPNHVEETELLPALVTSMLAAVGSPANTEVFRSMEWDTVASVLLFVCKVVEQRLVSPNQFVPWLDSCTQLFPLVVGQYLPQRRFGLFLRLVADLSYEQYAVMGRSLKAKLSAFVWEHAIQPVSPDRNDLLRVTIHGLRALDHILFQSLDSFKQEILPSLVPLLAAPVNDITDDSTESDCVLRWVRARLAATVVYTCSSGDRDFAIKCVQLGIPVIFAALCWHPKAHTGRSDYKGVRWMSLFYQGKLLEYEIQWRDTTEEEYLKILRAEFEACGLCAFSDLPKTTEDEPFSRHESIESHVLDTLAVLDGCMSEQSFVADSEWDRYQALKLDLAVVFTEPVAGVLASVLAGVEEWHELPTYYLARWCDLVVTAAPNAKQCEQTKEFLHTLESAANQCLVRNGVEYSIVQKSDLCDQNSSKPIVKYLKNIEKAGEAHFHGTTAIYGYKIAEAGIKMHKCRFTGHDFGGGPGYWESFYIAERYGDAVEWAIRTSSKLDFMYAAVLVYDGPRQPCQRFNPNPNATEYEDYVNLSRQRKEHVIHKRHYWNKVDEVFGPIARWDHQSAKWKPDATRGNQLAVKTPSRAVEFDKSLHKVIFFDLSPLSLNASNFPPLSSSSKTSAS